MILCKVIDLVNTYKINSYIDIIYKVSKKRLKTSFNTVFFSIKIINYHVKII